ncbi:MAG TPA: response regulator [Candidatus Binatia bacterium]|jgi:CheY-like chemotaxis protein|nr:response regulator [Candidatus Binatia bacterium]
MDHRHRILLVEDHDDLRMAVAEMLRLEGYEVAEASDGQEALCELRAGPSPCVVLLDLHMPGVDGREFRAAQLLDRQLAGVPVVALSGHGGIAQQAQAMRMADYIQKPIDLDKLLSVLRRLCQKAA